MVLAHYSLLKAMQIFVSSLWITPFHQIQFPAFSIFTGIIRFYRRNNLNIIYIQLKEKGALEKLDFL